MTGHVASRFLQASGEAKAMTTLDSRI